MPKKPCVRCGKPGRTCLNPFELDVNNRKVKTVLCDDCYNALVAEV